MERKRNSNKAESVIEIERGSLIIKDRGQESSIETERQRKREFQYHINTYLIQKTVSKNMLHHLFTVQNLNLQSIILFYHGRIRHIINIFRNRNKYIIGRETGTV